MCLSMGLSKSFESEDGIGGTCANGVKPELEADANGEAIGDECREVCAAAGRGVEGVSNFSNLALREPRSASVSPAVLSMASSRSEVAFWWDSC